MESFTLPVKYVKRTNFICFAYTSLFVESKKKSGSNGSLQGPSLLWAAVHCSYCIKVAMPLLSRKFAADIHGHLSDVSSNTDKAISTSPYLKVCKMRAIRCKGKTHDLQCFEIVKE